MFYLLSLFFFISSVMASSDKIDNFGRRSAYDYDLYESVLDPELCQRHLQEMNAFEFYDASFRIPQGMLRGNSYSLGNYHQCLAIDQPLEEDSIRGKYCLIQTQSLSIPILTGDSWPPDLTWLDVKNVGSDHYMEAFQRVQREFSVLNDDYSRTMAIDMINAVPLSLALCIPRSCAVDDVLRPLTEGSVVQFNYTEEFCRLPDDKPYSGADIAALVVFSVIGCLTLISTAYELHHIFIKKETSKPDELWSSFSVYGNTDRLLTLGSRPGALDCLDGIRALSILWVIFGHTFLHYFGLYLSNILDFYEWSLKLRSVIVLVAEVSVDSFFVLSGLLLVYTTASKMKQMQLVKNVHLFYLGRVLRVFPLLAAAVLLQASVLHRVADGVRWNRVARETDTCRDYWWSALLHIQNLVNPIRKCLPHSWYLSVDVQLYILSPLLLFWVLGSRRSAWSGFAAAVLSSLTFVTIYCFIKDFYVNNENGFGYLYFYQNTLTRSPVFILGMLCGYVLHISRDKKIKMSPWVVCSGYALAIVMSGYCMYQVHADWDSRVWYNLNMALFRSAWAASLCWLIIACVNGYSGPINWFLSLNLWKFLARISYAMYLFHYPMQLVTSGADIMPAYFSMENAFVYFANDVAYSVIVSVAACVLIDAPCATLIRRAMMGITPKKTSDKPTENHLTEEGNQRQDNEENKQNGKPEEGHFKTKGFFRRDSF